MNFQGNYNIEREAGEPDPHVIDLNTEIGECHDLISTTLPIKEQQYVPLYLVLMLRKYSDIF